jgi:hypothetical protein
MIDAATIRTISTSITGIRTDINNDDLAPPVLPTGGLILEGAGCGVEDVVEVVDDDSVLVGFVGGGFGVVMVVIVVVDAVVVLLSHFGPM